jgi:hypothetical protein
MFQKASFKGRADSFPTETSTRDFASLAETLAYIRPRAIRTGVLEISLFFMMFGLCVSRYIISAHLSLFLTAGSGPSLIAFKRLSLMATSAG